MFLKSRVKNGASGMSLGFQLIFNIVSLNFLEMFDFLAYPWISLISVMEIDYGFLSDSISMVNPNRFRF